MADQTEATAPRGMTFVLEDWALDIGAEIVEGESQNGWKTHRPTGKLMVRGMAGRVVSDIAYATDPSALNGIKRVRVTLEPVDE